MAATIGDTDISGIDDPSEYKQSRRIRAILDARDHVIEQRRRARDLMLEGVIKEEIADEMIRDAVETYLLESEHVVLDFLPDDDDDEEDWSKENRVAHNVWEETELGTVELVTREVDMVGLRSYLDAPDEFVDVWVESEDDPIQGESQIRRELHIQMPSSISMAAYRSLNRFWHSMGMDLKMNHKLPVDKVAYEQ